MFGIGKFLYVILLVVNGIAILSEDRFLNRIGWGSSGQNTNGFQYQQFQAGAGSDNESIKSRLVNLIGAIRTLLRVPLIGINIIVILYELVLG
ncbi:hypothetical protein PGUG_02993 [Meyerozyma guilliermondii ATCC 6260]|uniref:Protein transport protein YOS1 n=1 Tax=Meyerozyma guilliermondii (strain ATCC 6260 / CBS 566 / DSM 6381 / JCM 1539 / NBRC 10279 / NRRL Y-324) TaxID=294746 RepID=A5DI92_PICGU|nr:uncharacterized protein PGUG_02993 [Meyerozyma guilliermondii ATCC 6260]EDK38895.1 hypothetical protein PGUG_02993 [Meyerozyma guilliermondii ATCC 6260]